MSFRYVASDAVVDGEESVDLGVYLVCYRLEILQVVLEIQIVSVNYQQRSIICSNPVFVPLVQSSKIVETYALLVFTPALLNLRNQVRNGGADLDKQIRLAHKRHHQVEQL